MECSEDEPSDVSKRDKGYEGDSNTRWRVRKVMLWSTREDPSIKMRAVGMSRARQAIMEKTEQY